VRPFRSGAGVVEAFDDDRGLGTLVDDDGDRLPFHCTAIADGTRTVDVGRRVAFVVAPGRLGGWEAASLTKL
jgi:cold shock CspA family protein